MHRREAMRRAGKAVRVLLAGCLLNLTAGCFVLQPLGDEIPAPDTDLRVDLTPEASARVSVQAGRPIYQVVGRVIQADADSLVLAVRWADVPGAPVGHLGNDVVRLALHETTTISRPRFAATRTALFAGGLIAGIIAIVTIAIGAADPGGDDGTDTPQPR